MKNLDPSAGVQNFELAGLDSITKNQLGGCEEYAIVAMWDF